MGGETTAASAGKASRSAGWAVWFVGLPGSGKSTLAGAVRSRLAEQGIEAVHLQMDERRKIYFPDPTYSPEERVKAYELFAQEAADLVGQGKAVLMDGTAYQLAMRHLARRLVQDNHPGRFAEAYLHCDLETAIARESSRPEGLVMAGLYEKALKRRETGEQFEGLGQVIGVDVEFETDPRAEIVLDAAKSSVDEMCDAVLAYARDHF